MTHMVEIVHDEVRGLFEEIAASPRDPTDRLWTILQLTEEHYPNHGAGRHRSCEPIRLNQRWSNASQLPTTAA